MPCDSAITSRISAYSCCMGMAMYKRLSALRDGDTEKAEAELRNGLVLNWAIGVLRGYTLSDGKCCAEIPSTDEEVECAIRVAGPLCTSCVCVPCTDTGVVAPSCDPVVAYEADEAVEAQQRGAIEDAGPADGDTYLVVGGSDGVWSSPSLQEWSDGAWTATVPDEGEVVQAGSVPWVVHNGFSVLLYPGYDLTLVSENSGYQAVPTDASSTASLGRTVDVQTRHNGVWTTILTTPEDSLNGLTVNLGSLPVDDMRLVYVEGACRHNVPIETIVPPPNTCGTVTVTAFALPVCHEGTFTITVVISGNSGYPLGPLRYTVGNTTTDVPSSLGINTLGPWDTGTEVSVVLTNANDPACNKPLGTFTTEECLCPPFGTGLLKDASFQDSALPTEHYFIVSDTTGAGNEWASHVGSLVFNGAYTIVPVHGEVLASGSYSDRWVWTGSEALPFNPGMALTYDATSLLLVSQHPAVHGIYSRTAKVTVSFGSAGEVVVYEGPEAALSTLQSIDNIWSPLEPISVAVDYGYGGCVDTGLDGTVGPIDFCTITPDYTVTRVADASYFTLLAAYYDYYTSDDWFYVPRPKVLVASDTEGFLPAGFETAFGHAPAFAVGDIVEIGFDGSSFTFTQIWTPAIGEVVENVERLWIPETSPGVPPDAQDGWGVSWDGSDGLLAPVDTMGYLNPPGVYDITPAGAVKYMRTYTVAVVDYSHSTIVLADATPPLENQVKVEVEVDGAWSDLAMMQDADLTTPVTLVHSFFATRLRTTVIYNDTCEGEVALYDLSPLELNVAVLNNFTSEFGATTPLSLKAAQSTRNAPFVESPGIVPVMQSAWYTEGPFSVSPQPWRCLHVPASDPRFPYAGLINAGVASLKVGSGDDYDDPAYPLNPTEPVSDLQEWFVPNPSPPPTYISNAPSAPDLTAQRIVGVSTMPWTFGTEPYEEAHHVALVAGSPTFLMMADLKIVSGSYVTGSSRVPLTGIPEEDKEIACCAIMDVDTYVVGTRGNVYWTSNAGAAWTVVSPTLTANTHMVRLSSTVVLVASSDGVYRSTDAGHSWTASPVAAGLSGYNFHALDADTVTYGGSISLDGGLTWTAMTLPEDADGWFSVAVVMLTPQVIFFGSKSLWVSFDQGQTLQPYFVQPGEEWKDAGGNFSAFTVWIPPTS